MTLENITNSYSQITTVTVNVIVIIFVQYGRLSCSAIMIVSTSTEQDGNTLIIKHQ